ncbi:GNAT family N-acetyltransferase [Brevibacillus sp. SYSU BS000544]|uniref:GNAT family N-acetyltransferase n=1 Tax=Brevibacillus sp. SYSU BS000544 TaxID=3416443 RepID=UPI003CE4A655
MDMLLKIIELDFAYLDTFSKRVDTEWGSLFCNEKNPLYYDANHAHVHRLIQDPVQVVDEVITFYQSRGIFPRFYIYDIDQHQALLAELRARQFGIEELVAPVQLWQGKVISLERNPAVTIEKVTEANFDEAVAIECSIKELGGKIREQALREEFNHSGYTHFLLRYEGVACSTACIFQHGSQARMESVATLESYRGKGLIGELIAHVQEEAIKKGYENLWVFPINERVEKVYQKYGFETVDSVRVAHAFLGGKSIAEVREG